MYHVLMGTPTAEPRNPAPLGGIEPRALLLKRPQDDQMLYKIMSVENLLRSTDGAYLHFNRMDGYRDFPGADHHDGEQLPTDRPINALSKFERTPDFSAADYYDRFRSCTYACCFSLENSDYIWINYATGAVRGKVGIVFHFGRLRAMLNQACDPEKFRLSYNGLLCWPIFSLNYGLVEYVDFDAYRINEPYLPNPIRYVYLKSATLYSQEKELRITLSAPGMGHFALNDGSLMDFPRSLEVPFDFRQAFTNSAIEKLLCSPDCDTEFLRAELEKRRIAPAPGSDLRRGHMSSRDEFPESTKKAVAARASWHCSFSGCAKPTVGPSEESPDGVIMLGKAAHISGAAPGKGSRRASIEQAGGVKNPWHAIYRVRFASLPKSNQGPMPTPLPNRASAGFPG